MTADVNAWRQFLSQFSQDVLDLDTVYATNLPPEVVASRWLGFAPATDQQIRSAERRLGVALPPSYRTFLSTTDGFRRTSEYIEGVWPADKIEWFGVTNPDWIAAWDPGDVPPVPDAGYFVYGPDQDPTLVRREYLRSALQISEGGQDGVYLLNPRVLTTDGEWEAWYFADWLWGATRYRSFSELIRHQCEGYARRLRIPNGETI